jgi:hypothetical protein
MVMGEMYKCKCKGNRGQRDGEVGLGRGDVLGKRV